MKRQFKPGFRRKIEFIKNPQKQISIRLESTTLKLELSACESRSKQFYARKRADIHPFWGVPPLNERDRFAELAEFLEANSLDSIRSDTFANEI